MGGVGEDEGEVRLCMHSPNLGDEDLLGAGQTRQEVHHRNLLRLSLHSTTNKHEPCVCLVEQAQTRVTHADLRRHDDGELHGALQH